MTMTCCVPRCKMRRKKGSKLFMTRIPKNNSREKWITSISENTSRAEWQPGPNSVVCEVLIVTHFLLITRFFTLVMKIENKFTYN